MEPLDEVKQAAQDFVGQLAAGDFAGAARRFDENVAKALPEARLKDIWAQVIAQAGPFHKVTGSTAEAAGERHLVTAACQFEKGPLEFRVTFNAQGQISGLTYQPAQTPYRPPAYVQPEAFQDEDVTVGSGEWALPGSLSRPRGAGPFPAVVLVHGSGAQDRDETIGPNQPFRDLAWGLASRGVAVLRYDKRTKAHGQQYTPERVAAITVQDEVIDDALAAVELLRRTPGIDPRRLYVLGHSLGGTLAPRLGQQDPALAGLIVMAGMTRTLEDTLLDQYTYLYHLAGGPTPAQQAELEALKVKVARVKDPDLSETVPAKDLPLDVHPAYWLSLRGYHPAAVAATLAMRLFVLQAGRDYQVTTAGDYPAWQAALGGQPNATLKLYPKLFHLFIEGEGPSTPQEYLVEGHVSEEVIEDIARWVKAAPGS